MKHTVNLGDQKIQVTQTSVIQPHLKDDFSILPKLVQLLPQDKPIWIGIPLAIGNFIGKVKVAAGCGFSHPYITDKSPSGKLSCLVMAMIRDRDRNKISCTQILYKVYYVLNQFRSPNDCDTCSIHVRFSEKVLEEMRRCINHHKELGGTLRMDRISKVDRESIFIIDIDPNEIHNGGDEHINISSSRYNFHSHPEKAYIKHSVENGWPSLTDFMGLYDLGNRTIFHCVATKEGVYVISFGSYWVNHLDKVSTSFIKNNYRISRKKGYSISDFLRIVNNIKKDDHPVFHVQFLPWGSRARSIFSVVYKRSGKTCIPDDRTMKYYNKFT